MTSPHAVLPEKTLFDVLRDVWRSRFYMAFFVVIFLISAFVFLSFAQKFYRAEMIIAPATPMGQGMRATSHIGEGSIQVQHENLQGTAAFIRFEAIYDGMSVASVLMQDKEILAAIRFDRTFEFSAPRVVLGVANLSEYLKKRVTLEPVSGTPLRRLVYLHPNKDFAMYMIARLHRVSDEIIRRRILQEVDGRIEYLDLSLAATINPDHRRNLTALLIEQERLKMLVSLDQPYAATIIERPFVSATPRWPDPYIIYSVFVFVGLLFGFIVHGLRHHG
ncbi:MAG: hypothetical protein COA45_08680 [Zetaproteobacteria bacterium]|nr:MAG: hypothetical protein COA45_08680 [Zetaproteobacteria bacterium]